MPTPTLSAAEIINRFNTMVRNQAVYLNSAPRHSGSFPQQGSPGYVPDSRLGSQSEVVHSATDLASSGYLSATIVFNILHGFAMELTRVRRVHAFHLKNVDQYIDGGTDVTALKPEFAAYFPIPYQPTIGAPVDNSILDGFLIQLRTRVNQIRNTDTYRIDIVTCHNNCHNSCHSSRNRR